MLMFTGLRYCATLALCCRCCPRPALLPSPEGRGEEACEDFLDFPEVSLLRPVPALRFWILSLRRFANCFYLLHKKSLGIRSQGFSVIAFSAPARASIPAVCTQTAPAKTDLCRILSSNYREIAIRDFAASGRSASSMETLSTKSTLNCSLSVSSFFSAGVMSASRRCAISRKLSKYICCRS